MRRPAQRGHRGPGGLQLRLQPLQVVGHGGGTGSRVGRAQDALHVRQRDVELAQAVDDLGGRDLLGAAARFPAARLGEALESVPFVRDDGRPATVLYIRQEEFRAVSAADVFAADVDAAVAGAMAVTQRPIVAEALEEEATRAAWRTVPSWTLVTTRDLAVPVASQRCMAERASSRAVEVDASHAVTVSRPDAVAALVGEAARATAG